MFEWYSWIGQELYHGHYKKARKLYRIALKYGNIKSDRLEMFSKILPKDHWLLGIFD